MHRYEVIFYTRPTGAEIMEEAGPHPEMDRQDQDDYALEVEAADPDQAVVLAREVLEPRIRANGHQIAAVQVERIGE